MKKLLLFLRLISPLYTLNAALLFNLWTEEMPTRAIREAILDAGFKALNHAIQKGSNNE